MIKSIRLVNWRSHSDSKLEFRKGTNLLIGIMGAGKSSILESISFALFGTFPALERRKIKLDNIVRLNEPLAKVILEFEWEGATYRIERTIERLKKGTITSTSTSAELYKNNSLLEHGSVAVTSYLQNLTSVDYDLFTRAIYSEQNNIDYFLILDPRRRKEEIDVLLGLDKFELARANVVTVANKIRSKRETIEERFSRDKITELDSKEKSQSEAKCSLEATIVQVIASYEKHSEEAASLAAQLSEMKKNKELFEQFNKNDLRLSAQVEVLKKELEGKNIEETVCKLLEVKLQSLIDGRAKLASSVRLLDEKNNTLSKECGSIESKIKSIQESKTKQSTIAAELTALLSGQTQQSFIEKQKQIENSLIAFESERKSLEREVAETNDTLQKLKPDLSECPLCTSKLTTDTIARIKAEKDSAIKQKRARITELITLSAQGKKENEELLAKIRRISLSSERLTSIMSEVENLETFEVRKAQLISELAKIIEEKRVAQAKLDEMSGELEQLRLEVTTNKTLITKQRELMLIDKKLNETRVQLANIKFDEKKFEELRIAAEKSKIEAERLLSSRTSAEAQLRMASDMLNILREELTTLKVMEMDIKQLSALEEQLLVYKNALLETQTSLRLSLTSAINTAMNEIWPMLYPYRNYHALRLGVSEKDYTFEIDDGNGWHSLEVIASGGERACAALALRVALAMVLTPKLSWLILDEPTHNLDREAVSLLSSALELKVPEVVKQTFVITHDEAFMSSEFASSYRLIRDKNRNGETKVETT